MDFQVLNDLHLEFGSTTLSGGDVLFLSGDICVADYLRPERTDKYARRHVCRYKQFFFDECAKYNRVFYVMGNHEHYNGVFDFTAEILRDFLKDTNVTLLDNEFADLDEQWVLFGGTFWTDYNKNDWFTKHAAKDKMSDHVNIKKINSNGPRTFLPEDAMDAHYMALEKLKFGLSVRQDKNIVVMTHHAPHVQSVKDFYRGQLLNGAYYSDQENLILDNPQIKYWFHGHMHHNFDYMVGDHCRVVCNPRGYAGHYLNEDFNPHFKITLC